MCDIFGVSRSGYYDWLQRPESNHKIEDMRLSQKIKVIHSNSRGNYGTRPIKKELEEEHGDKVSRRRIGRLMRRQGLVSKSKRKFKATTNSKHNKPVALNLLKRKFNVEQPNKVYAGDITYIPTQEGWCVSCCFNRFIL